MNKNVYIEINKESEYPRQGFHPHVCYPEYRYGKNEIQEKNDVYQMVRNCLIGMNLDIGHLGTKMWNPLGKYINPGDNVLIKPNWVMHYNGATNIKENSMECLVTHPSCLRAICDYCFIALQGKGKVLIADAPMQDCDLNLLLDGFGYRDILNFYLQKGENIAFADLRKYQSIFDSNKIITNKIYQNGEGIDVDLSKLSIHEKRNGKRIYQVDNYDKAETGSYHGKNRHVYSINKDVLNSDVVINFCKPKSHRLAGFTAAMKNMVGIAYNKASLPHRTEGSIAEGGDAYPNKSLVKKLIDEILNRKIIHEDNKEFTLALVDRLMYGLIYVIVREIGKDPYIKGIWYGNDTIWRTVVDLNYIEQFADKNGEICDCPQRKILNFGDMIIAGDHNGPCQPEPKHLGIIIASDSAISMDLAICKMIGFPEDKIPMIHALNLHEADYLFGDCTNNIEISSNDPQITGKLEEIHFPKEWKYVPHVMWKDILL